MKYLFGLLLLFFTISAFAQEQEKPLIQFSGIVRGADSTHMIVPYVSITNKIHHNESTASNYEGYFSFVVHEQDTLEFTCVGYAPVTVVIPANLAKKSYTKEVTIRPIILNLPMVSIFPWATTDEFTKDFLTMKIADDDLEIARKNLNLKTILDEAHNMPRDGSEPLDVNQMHNNMVNAHSITNPLLNPFAWGALIKQISDGDKSKSSGN